MSFDRFQELADAVPAEIVTHSLVREFDLPGAGRFALITLDNEQDAGKPTTIGPRTLLELGRTLENLRQRAETGGLSGIGVTGKPHFFVAGADLTTVKVLQADRHGRLMAELGHAAYNLLSDMPVPTFAFINGVALGGGLELALAAKYRTVSRAADGIGLPEAFIGLIPGWGGVYKLPRLIGPDAALSVMIENPLNNNRSLSGSAAFGLGIADALFDSSDFLAESLAWAGRILAGDRTLLDPIEAARNRTVGEAVWAAAVARGRALVEAKTANAAPAPGRVLDLFEAGRTRTREESAAAECDALVDLMQSPQFSATVYAFLELVQKRAKRPAGAPDRGLARPVRKVGVVGAGLMAGQLALLFARQLEVPVVMTDIDQVRVDKGVGQVVAEIDKLLAKQRISADAADRTRALVTGSVSKEVFADADFVIEAVFEEPAVKKQVLAELEAIVRPECILATNTSSLSVTDMSADLLHPERVVGFHFFNPVAVMSLIEIVRAPRTGDAVLATAFDLARQLKKTGVLVKDAPAFVVNRVLLRTMGEVVSAFDEGTDPLVADNALRPMGLPMMPFELLAMVGLPVAQHVTESLHAAFGDRFRVSANLQRLIDAGIRSLWAPDGEGGRSIPRKTLELLDFGDRPSTSEELLARTQDALAEEIGLMLEEEVVAGPEDIDLCMILGAGWPMHLGGITPYLDRVGASERVNGRRFHPEPAVPAGPATGTA